MPFMRSYTHRNFQSDWSREVWHRGGNRGTPLLYDWGIRIPFLPLPYTVRARLHYMWPNLMENSSILARIALLLSIFVQIGPAMSSF